MCSPDLSRHELNTVENIQSALTALNKLHGHGVVHGDLKPEHIRSYQDRETGKVQACFVDFGLSGEQGAKSKGCTWEFASFERLLSDKMSTLSMIDDYEALFLCALIQIDPAWLPRPPQAETESRKNHLRAKLEFMGRISSCANQQQENSILRWVCQKLMLVWQHPRGQEVGEEFFSQLADPSLVPFDLDALRARVLAKFEQICELKEVKEDKLPETSSHAGERARHEDMLKQALMREHPNVAWYTGVARSSDNTLTVEYDSLFVLKGLQQNPSLWVKNSPAKTRFRTLTTLAGQVVYEEAGHGVKTVWHFVDKIDYLKMRPLEYLLLFAGIHVNAEEFAPMGNDSFAADAQCLELVSNNESQSSGWQQQLRVALKAKEDGALGALDIERAGKATYPCVGLATLIVAGRFFVENWGDNTTPLISQTSFPDALLQSGFTSTTCQNGQLKARLDDLTRRYDEESKKIGELQAQLTWAMQQSSRTVWFSLDGVLHSVKLSLADTVAELGEGLSVFDPKRMDTPLSPISLIPQSSPNAPLQAFRRSLDLNHTQK